jgi:hypothetical protein
MKAMEFQELPCLHISNRTMVSLGQVQLSLTPGPVWAQIHYLLEAYRPLALVGNSEAPQPNSMDFFWEIYVGYRNITFQCIAPTKLHQYYTKW